MQQTCIPLLVCHDIAAEHDFLVNILGFTSGGLHRTPDGQVVHGEVLHGSFVIWLHRVAADQKLAPPRSLPAATGGLVVFVPNVDSHHAKAKSHSAQIDSDPKDMPYGQREYGLTDP